MWYFFDFEEIENKLNQRFIIFIYTVYIKGY